MIGKFVVFSGVQPSGKLTIGNYIGAIRQWVKIQYDYQCIYCIADLHAITGSSNVRRLYEISLDTLALYLACGIDPDGCTVFIQSHVPEHSQLNWLLGCHTYYGELNRMIQFKEKVKQKKIDSNIGLFTYPVLMASDILLYQTNLVPVGEDQRQHLELARNIANRFNRTYGAVFVIPEMFTPKLGARVMSLLNPSKKMSKSDYNSDNVITMLDNTNIISRKIKRAVTDTDQPPIVQYDPINKPGISNLLVIFSGMSDQPISYLEEKFKGKTYVQLKCEMIKLVSSILSKLQDRYYVIRSDENKLLSILRDGAKKARERSHVTLKKVHKVMGLLNCSI